MTDTPTKPEDFVRVIDARLQVYAKGEWHTIGYPDTEHVQDAIRAACEVAVEAETAKLMEFVREVAAESHAELCPLNHPAYEGKWCSACEAEKLLEADRKMSLLDSAR